LGIFLETIYDKNVLRTGYFLLNAGRSLSIKPAIATHAKKMFHPFIA